MNKYKWLASVTCPKMYPVCVSKSILIYDDGFSYLESGEYLKGEWGASLSENYTDYEKKPIPYRLVVHWLSYAESKFYKGVFDLPTERMEYHFKKGHLNFYGEQKTYSRILVGLAPEGVVVVWLSTPGSACVEIGRFQAEITDEITVDDVAPGVNDYGDYPTAKDFTETFLEPEIKEYVKLHGLGNHLWDAYRKPFFYRTIIEYASPEGKTFKLFQEYYNGEEEYLSMEEIQSPQYYLKARIKRIGFRWSDKGIKYIGLCDFDEQEIFKVYNQIYKNNPEQKGEIVIRINSSNDYMRIFLRNESAVGTLPDEIMLHKCQIMLDKVKEEDE